MTEKTQTEIIGRLKQEMQNHVELTNMDDRQLQELITDALEKEIKNAKAEITPDEIVFNDLDILEDTLISLKQISHTLDTAKSEASNKDLITTYDTLSKSMFNTTRDVFNLMFENGWYTLEEADAAKIKKTYDKFNSRKEEMKI